VVSRQQSLTSRLSEIKRNLGSRPDDYSLFTLLMNGGPRLDPRSPNSIGFMKNAIVVHAFNDHDAIVAYDNVPYLMWVKSTAGLATGQKVPPAPVSVAGTETVEVPGVGSQSLTILNSVMETEVREALFDFREWTDVTGTYTVEAKLIEVNDQGVLLEKRDGSQVTVPLDSLSEEDVERVGR